MRVAYLCCDFGIPIFGTKGASVHICELTQALANAGCDVHLLVARQGGNPTKDWSLPVHQFKLTGWPAIVQDLLTQEAHIPGWERRIKDWRALAYAQYLAQAAQPMLRRLMPDILYERYSLFSWAGQALANDLGIPHVVEINAPLVKEQARYRQLELNATAIGLERRILLGADLVVAVSRQLRDYVLGLGARAEDVIVLPNGVDIQRFSPQVDGDPVRRAFGLEDAFVIGFVGSLKPWHGVDGLLAACAGLPDALPWRLLLIGEGPEQASIAEQAARLGLSGRVIFTGSVPYDQVPVYLAAMDVAVAPYPALDDFYFSPLKLFEYMAMKRPVVAPAIGQISEVVVHQHNGWLYPTGDIGALRDALRLLATDIDLRDRLGARARAYVVAQHTWAQNAERLIAWIGRLKQKQNGRARPSISSRDRVNMKPVG